MTASTIALLQKHFDLALEAPDGIKRLRELILTLAMQGKLVPQDPSDQSASELLKEIEAEKKRLVKEGKIKAPKPLPEIKPEEVPYSVPRGWEWVTIRHICHDWGQKEPDGYFTYIDVGSINNSCGYISSPEVIPASEAPSRARKIVKKGSVIYSTVRPYLLNIAIVDQDFSPEPIASTAFAIVHPYIQVNEKFIYQFLRSPSFITYVESTMKGVAYPAINDGDFFIGLFPLPPLAEQKRIVAKIDQLMATCDALEQLRNNRQQKRLDIHTAAITRLLDAGNPGDAEVAWTFLQKHFGELYSVKGNVAELRKAILQLAVMGKLVPQDPDDQPASELLKEIEAEKKRLVKEGKIKAPKLLPEIKTEDVPYAVPKGWEWVRLGALVQIINGRAYKQQELLETGVPVLRVGNLFTSNKWYFSDLALEDDKYIDNGDLIFAWSASFGPFIWDGGKVIYHYHIWKLSIFHELKVYKNYVFQYLLGKTESIKRSGNGIAMMHMTKERMELLPIPLPPLAEQKRIVAKIDELMTLCVTLESQIDKATVKQTALFDAVLAKV